MKNRHWLVANGIFLACCGGVDTTNTASALLKSKQGVIAPTCTTANGIDVQTAAGNTPLTLFQAPSAGADQVVALMIWGSLTNRASNDVRNIHGTTTIDYNVAGANVLVLANYEETHWVLDNHGTKPTKIIMNVFGDSFVDGADGIPVEYDGAPYESGDFPKSASELPDFLPSATQDNVTFTAYAGAYRADGFSVQLGDCQPTASAGACEIDAKTTSGAQKFTAAAASQQVIALATNGGLSSDGADGGQSAGNVSVSYNVSGASILVLSNHDPIKWTFTNLGTPPSKIVLLSYFEASIDGAGNIPVEAHQADVQIDNPLPNATLQLETSALAALEVTSSAQIDRTDEFDVKMDACTTASP